MPDMMTRGKLFSVEVDGHGSMIALSPRSGLELARVKVHGNDTYAHTAAAENLMVAVFENLEAQGYPHAHDDDEKLPEEV